MSTALTTSGTGVPGLSRRTRRGAAVALLDSLEDAYQGRDGMIHALSATSDPRAARLASLLSDPQWRGKSLATACADADIAPGTVLMLLRDGAISHAVADAHLRLQARLPAVVDQIADAAEGGLVTCPCTIGGQKDALPDCPRCRGTGQTVSAPSLPHQELVLQTLGLVGGKGGGAVNVNVQQQQTVVAGGGSGIFDAFVKTPLPKPSSRPPDIVIAATPGAMPEEA
jgi:hypothetical protein